VHLLPLLDALLQLGANGANLIARNSQRRTVKTSVNQLKEGATSTAYK
jgi:hypothetical protein